MNEQMRFPARAMMITAAASAALALLVAFSGCQKETPTAREQMQQTPTQEHASVDPAQDEPVAVEQTTCPVMGGAINKAVFVEYQGKKVYFCCAGCEKDFLANPEKYIAKLPQFKH